MRPCLTISHSHAQALLQDRGRFGVRHQGISQSGALDWVSQAWANWLLGNPVDTCVIEVCIGGLGLHCLHDTTLALAGADLDATLDGQPLASWQAFPVRAGQVLEFRQPRQGLRAYLAAPGGFDAPMVLGSRSSMQREHLGGLHGNGRPLQAGDTLACATSPTLLRQMPGTAIPDLAQPPCLDTIVGAQSAGFSGQGLFDAFNHDWVIDTRADRMGMRLLGPSLEYQGPAMVSEGIPLGAIQVPADGQPIILLNDRQTIGGYPRLGALTPLACARLGQCLPGSTLRLRPCPADRARQQHLRQLAAWH